MGCQTSTEVKKFANDQPTDPPKQQNNESSNLDDLKEEAAATKIQALYRGFRTRLKLQENQSDKKAEKKRNKQEEEQRADELLKVVLEDKAKSSQEAKFNQRNSEEEVFRSLRKIIQKSIDQDEPPEEANDSLVDQVNVLAASIRPKLKDTKEQVSSKLTSGLELASKTVEQAFEEAKKTGQSIKETIQEETKQELENTEQVLKETAHNAEDQMNQLKEKFQEFDISKVASETVENVKEKVTGLLPDKVKEMLPDSEKKDSDRPDSGKSEASDTTVEKSEKSNESKDVNNNPEDKKQQEEEVDIDLGDPEVAKVANKLQSAFKSKIQFKRHTAKQAN